MYSKNIFFTTPGSRDSQEVVHSWSELELGILPWRNVTCHQLAGNLFENLKVLSTSLVPIFSTMSTVLAWYNYMVKFDKVLFLAQKVGLWLPWAIIRSTLDPPYKTENWFAQFPCSFLAPPNTYSKSSASTYLLEVPLNCLAQISK